MNADASGNCAVVSASGQIFLRAGIDRASGVVSITRSAQREMMRMEKKHRLFVCDQNDLRTNTKTKRMQAGGARAGFIIFPNANAPSGQVQYTLNAIADCGADSCVYASDADTVLVSGDACTATVTVNVLGQ